MAEQKKGNDSIPWVLIGILFFLGLWPISLVILLVKLYGKDEKKTRQAPPLSAETKQTKREKGKGITAVRKVTKSPVPKKSTAKILGIIGVLLLVVGFYSCADPIEMMIWAGKAEVWYVKNLLQGLGIVVAGGAMLGSGISMDSSLKRYQRYLVVMGQRQAISTDELGRTLGLTKKRVEKDLWKMLDKGYFGGKAYYNVELGYLFRSSAADAAFKKRQEEAAAAKQPAAAEQGYNGVLMEIRRANDEIADPVLSAKIDQLETLAARIFHIVEEEPEKAERIATFFNYYLPTTQKLLDSYAKFESAGIEGENLRLAKARIESTMDTIVHGFEHQLDELYQSDVLDVDRDIRVMETMLNRDTASVEQDFGLSSQAAAWQQEETSR